MYLSQELYVLKTMHPTKLSIILLIAAKLSQNIIQG